MRRPAIPLQGSRPTWPGDYGGRTARRSSIGYGHSSSSLAENRRLPVRGRCRSRLKAGHRTVATADGSMGQFLRTGRGPRSFRPMTPAPFIDRLDWVAGEMRLMSWPKGFGIRSRGSCPRAREPVPGREQAPIGSTLGSLLPRSAVRGMRDLALVKQKIADALYRHRVAWTIDDRSLSSLKIFRHRPGNSG